MRWNKGIVILAAALCFGSTAFAMDAGKEAEAVTRNPLGAYDVMLDQKSSDAEKILQKQQWTKAESAYGISYNRSAVKAKDKKSFNESIDLESENDAIYKISVNFTTGDKGTGEKLYKEMLKVCGEEGGKSLMDAFYSIPGNGIRKYTLWHIPEIKEVIIITWTRDRTKPFLDSKETNTVSITKVRTRV